MNKLGNQDRLVLPPRLRRQMLWFAIVYLPLLSACASTRKTPTPPAPAPTSAVTGTTTIVAIAPPASAGCDVSIPKMLGLPQIAAGMGEVLRRIGSRLSVGLDLTGRFPGLQPQPPLIPLSDPANLDEGAPPAVQAAAKIKAEEDAAPQKIMAIRYLATLGCGGCYEDVEQALLEAMSDCTEEVRFEAVKALQCRPDCGCRFCTSPSCCSEPVRKRLEELTTCEKEPSTRVNRMARLALACCQTKPLMTDDIPREGPTPAPAQEPQSASILTEEVNDPVALLFSGVQLASYQWNATGSQVQTAIATNALPNNVVENSLVQPASIQTPGTQNTATPPAVPHTAVSQSQSNSFGQFASPEPSSQKTLAMVNGERIVASQVLTLVDAKKKQLASRSQPIPSDQQLMSSELERLIDWCLIHQIACSELLPIVPASTAAVSTSRLTVSETQAWLSRKLAVDAQVAPAEIMAYYQVHQQEYTTPARARWECLTILADQCKSADDVSQVAAYVKNKATGQNVNPPAGFQLAMVDVKVTPWQELHQVSPRLQEILSGLQPGQISQPFQQNKDLCLLRLLAREASQPMPVAAVAGRITQEVLKQRREAALQHFLAQARANAKIWICFESESSAAPAFNSVLAR